MKLSDFPQTQGFRTADWREVFAAGEFLAPHPGTGLRTLAPAFGPADVASVTALACVDEGQDWPARWWVASVVLADGRHAVLGALRGDNGHARWTVGREQDVVIIAGLDWTERRRLLLELVGPEEVDSYGVNHPSGLRRRAGGAVPRSALAQLELARALLAELAPLMWLSDEGDLMIAETPISPPAEALAWLREEVALE